MPDWVREVLAHLNPDQATGLQIRHTGRPRDAIDYYQAAVGAAVGFEVRHPDGRGPVSCNLPL